MTISFNGDVSGRIAETEDLSVFIIGKGMFYSNQTLRSVQTEFGVLTHRFDSVDQILEGSDTSLPEVSILVVDQMMMEDLLKRPEQYMQAAGSGRIVFAYRKEQAAGSLFSRWDRQQYGDVGYLPMNVTPDVWRSIIRLLLHDEIFLPTIFVDTVEDKFCAAPGSQNQPTAKPPSHARQCQAVYEQLTRREKQVLRLVSQGKSNKLIASNLGITEHTVKLHMHNVVGKIGVSNRTAAAHFYFEAAPEDARLGSVE